MQTQMQQYYMQPHVAPLVKPHTTNVVLYLPKPPKLPSNPTQYVEYMNAYKIFYERIHECVKEAIKVSEELSVVLPKTSNRAVKRTAYWANKSSQGSNSTVSSVATRNSGKIARSQHSEAPFHRSVSQSTVTKDAATILTEAKVDKIKSEIAINAVKEQKLAKELQYFKAPKFSKVIARDKDGNVTGFTESIDNENLLIEHRESLDLIERLRRERDELIQKFAPSRKENARREADMRSLENKLALERARVKNQEQRLLNIAKISKEKSESWFAPKEFKEVLDTTGYK